MYIVSQAIDADTSPAVVYRIISADAGFFSINSQTGVVSVASPLDYESTKKHTITISTDDGRGRVSQIPEAQTTVNINVLVRL